MGLAKAGKSALEQFVVLITTGNNPESIRVLAIFIITRVIVLCVDSVDANFSFLAGTKTTPGSSKPGSWPAPKIDLPPSSFLKRTCGFENYDMPAFCLCLENWLLKYPITYGIYDVLMCATLGFSYDRGLASPCADPTPLHFNGSERIRNANLLFLTFRILIKKPMLMQLAMGHLKTLVADSSLAGGCNCATIIQQYDWQVWLFKLLEDLTCVPTDDDNMSVSTRSCHQTGMRENIKTIFCSLHFFSLRSRRKLGLKFEQPRSWGSSAVDSDGTLMQRSGCHVFEESIILAQVFCLGVIVTQSLNCNVSNTNTASITNPQNVTINL